jgi:hypothetical protein
VTIPDLPTIGNLNSEQLLALRAAIDARLEAIRLDLVQQAERLGMVVTNGQPKKRRGRKPKDQDAVREE